jgi:formylglycine-generating enzyme required for sulfatase activity
MLAVVLPALMLLPQPAARAVADTTPPTGTIVINGNRSATNSRTVTIAMTWADTGGSGVARMRFSDDGSTWTAYESLAPSKSHTLPEGADGHRTIRVQFIDLANNRSATCSDYIRLDRSAPTGAIAINAGASSTMTRCVTLGLTCTDGTGSGVSKTRFSDNGSTWTAWENPKTTRAHVLPVGFGYHTVRVQYLDGAGNYSTVYSDYIKLAGPASGTTETITLPGDVPLEMLWIPGGQFTMGSADTEQDRQGDEGPQHSVTLTGYWLAKYELTKRQWMAVMGGTTPWDGYEGVTGEPETPAVYVSWNSAHSFLTALNTHTGRTFRLPSEAQWEYACRAGTTTRFYWEDDEFYLGVWGNAWYYGNSVSMEHSFAYEVGKRDPNAFGLYDMSGNVTEWCQDWYGPYGSGAQTNPTGPSTGEFRVFRGGAWDLDPQMCRSAFRIYNTPDSPYASGGFRIARMP